MKFPEMSRKSISAWLLLISFAFLGFSYLPLLSFGVVQGTHIDLSFTYIAWVLCVIATLGMLWHERRELFRNTGFKLLVLFSIWVSVTATWSPNHFRALVTAAFLWLIVGIVGTILVHKAALHRHYGLVLRIGTIIVISILTFSLWQIIGDALGVSRTLTLLPANYTSSVFGVARPTAFSLEPQFLASLLLIPYLWGVYKLFSTTLTRAEAILFVITTSTLILTLSRGGLLAAGIGTLMLLVSIKSSTRQYVKALGLFMLGLIGAIIVSYGAAAINTRDSISGYSAIRAQVNQLSLGAFNLPAESRSNSVKSGYAVSNKAPQPSYVVSSTSSRISMSSTALSLWQKDTRTLLFGVGIGGFGESIHNEYPNYPLTSVVNNVYLETLVEIGLVGFILFAAVLGFAFYKAARFTTPFFSALLAAFLIHWCFFSGNANVLHVWVFIGLIFLLAQQNKIQSHKPH